MQIRHIEARIALLRRQLTEHQLYHLLSDIPDVRVFMESHIFAVWDFMSLLKSLQNYLTCTTLPWKPVANAATARFINEIVLGEETDVDRNGVPSSHFELYREAMREVGADTRPITDLLAHIDSLADVDAALKGTRLPQGVEQFLRSTFDLIREGQPHKIAAAFTFGRESLIPEMFIEIIRQSGEDKSRCPRLLYYLERHIEVDGDEHGPLAEALVRELCGEDATKWEEAATVAEQALRRRIALWDGIAVQLQSRPTPVSQQHR